MTVTKSVFCALVSSVLFMSLSAPGIAGNADPTAQAKAADAPVVPELLPKPVEADSQLLPSIQPSLRKEALAAIDRALDWLAAHQKEDGSWSNGDFPALTGLPLWAFANSTHPEREKVAGTAVKYILSCVQKDGGIYREVPGKGGGLSNYNTSICMTALHALGRRDLVATVLAARSFVSESQHMGDDIYRGGFGYDKETGRAYTDLMNTVFAAEGMRLTEGAEAFRTGTAEKADVDWEAVRGFLRHMQNEAATGEDAGGFPYRPDESKAGTTTNAQGEIVFRSYGSMTYAGMLALMYADVPPDDPRIKSAFHWASKHWSLEENPGMGQQGLYFFYHVLTKSLAAGGQNHIPTTEDTAKPWRRDLVKKLLSLQKVETDGTGYWSNENSRFWEADSVLVTAYAVLAVQIALGQ